METLPRLRRTRLPIAGAAVVLLLVLIAFGSPLLVQLHLIADPLKQHVEFIEAAPGQNGYAFGADELGRDTLSRLLFGSRVSLAVGIFVQAIILPIGLAIGLTAGYFGRPVDNPLVRLPGIWDGF